MASRFLAGSRIARGGTRPENYPHLPHPAPGAATSQLATTRGLLRQLAFSSIAREPACRIFNIVQHRTLQSPPSVTRETGRGRNCSIVLELVILGPLSARFAVMPTCTGPSRRRPPVDFRDAKVGWRRRSSPPTPWLSPNSQLAQTENDLSHMECQW